ncbi:MAG TPA: tetratricopeptide repeat protein [Candidatus Krumholzibacteria bacterium]
MRTLRYGLLLVFLLVASVILLRTFERSRLHETPHDRLARLVGGKPATIDLDRLRGASAADLYQLGLEYLSMWRVRDAAAIFERSVAADSTQHDVWLRLVECYADPIIGNERALSHAVLRAEATVSAPADTLLVYGMQALYEKADYARAIALLSRAAREGGSMQEARLQLALAYYRLGQVGDAQRQLAPLVKDDPTVGRVAGLSIRCQAALGHWDRAAREAAELVRLNPEEPVPHVLLAQVELARDRPAAALESAQHALELDPFCVPAIITRALLYTQAGDFESARVSYEKLMLFDDVNLASVAHEGIAFADFLAGDFDDGVDEMDEAIRHAMLNGAHRRGLSLASRLVGYLCQLGRSDAAEGVVERWVTEFGDVPVRLSRARIQLMRGDVDAGSEALNHLATEKEWVLWARTLSLDSTELLALADIARQQQTDALDRLVRDEKERVAVNVADADRRTFLAGYAAFEAGNAEMAVKSFVEVRRRLYGLEFPYHGDPVLFVQSLFYRGESQLAGGNRAAAKDSYAAFVGYWGDAAWDLDAVARARQKVETLGGASAPPQG